MAQDSHSSNSGFGSLLMKGIMAIFSITVTATVSTIVQRYITPSAAQSSADQPAAIASPSAPMQATEASTLVPIAAPTFAPPVELTPAPEGQAIDPQPQTNYQAEPQPNPAIDPNAPVIVQVEPRQVEPQADAQPSPPPDSLRDQLNRTIQDKWSRN